MGVGVSFRMSVLQKPAVFIFGRIREADDHKEVVGRLPAIV